MGPIRYRLWRLLRTRWPSALAVALLVTVVGGVVLTLTAGALRTVSSPERYDDQRGGADDASLEQSEGPPRTEEVAALPAVERVDVMTFVFGGLVPSDSDQPVDALVFAGSLGAVGERLVEGRPPDASEPGEFVATRSWQEQAGAQLGDQLQLVTLTQAQADERGFDVADPLGPTLTATFVGVVDGPAELQDPTPLALFPASLLDQGDVGVSASVGLVSLAAGSTLDDLRAQLDSLPGGDVFGIDIATSVPSEVRSAVSAQGQGLAVVAAIIAVAAVAVLGQLLGRRARLPQAQRLTLSSIGLTPAQLVADPLSSVALSVAVGSVGAGIVAFAASGAFPVGFARRVEPRPGALFDPWAHALGPAVLAAALLLWVLVALAVGERQGHPDRLPGLTERVATRMRPGPAATGLRLAFTRHPRDPGSVRAPMVGLVAVLAVLVGALTFGSSLQRFIGDPIRFGNTADLGIGQGGDAIPDEAVAVLESDPDVAALTLYGTVLASVGSTTLDVTGMQPVRGDLAPDVLEGTLPSDDDEIILGRVSARQLEVGVGDDIAVKGSGDPATYRVTGIAVITGVEGGDGIGLGGMVTLPGLHRLEPDASLGSAGVGLRDGAPAGTAQRLSAATGMTIGGRFDPPSTVLNLRRVRATPFVVAIALGTLALLSLVQQLSLSTTRRRRDLAVIRALGADGGWVGRALHWQITLLAVVALAVATPLGVAAGRIVYERFIDRIGARTDISVPFLLLAATAAGLVALGNLAAIVPARRVRRQPPARVVAEE